MAQTVASNGANTATKVAKDLGFCFCEKNSFVHVELALEPPQLERARSAPAGFSGTHSGGGPHTQPGQQTASGWTSSKNKKRSRRFRGARGGCRAKAKAKAAQAKSVSSRSAEADSCKQTSQPVPNLSAADIKSWLKQRKAKGLLKYAESEAASREAQRYVESAIAMDKENGSIDCSDKQKSWPFLKLLLQQLQQEDVAKACVHQWAHHVLKMVINRCPPCLTKFVAEALNQVELVSPSNQARQVSLSDLATNSYGCRIIQHVLSLRECPQCCRSNISEAQNEEMECIKSKLVDRILGLGCGSGRSADGKMKMYDPLLKHQYGNYVCQAILHYGPEKHRQPLLQSIDRTYMGFARHQYAAYVVETRLMYLSYSGEADARAAMNFVQSLLKESVLIELAEKDGKGSGLSGYRVAIWLVLEVYRHVRMCSRGGISSIKPAVPEKIRLPAPKKKGAQERWRSESEEEEDGEAEEAGEQVEKDDEQYCLRKGRNRLKEGIKAIDCGHLQCDACSLREAFISQFWLPLHNPDSSLRRSSIHGSKFQKRLVERLTQQAFGHAPQFKKRGLEPNLGTHLSSKSMVWSQTREPASMRTSASMLPTLLAHPIISVGE